MPRSDPPRMKILFCKEEKKMYLGQCTRGNHSDKWVSISPIKMCKALGDMRKIQAGRSKYPLFEVFSSSRILNRLLSL